MTKATDFTADEWDLLSGLPFVVGGTSLAVIHPGTLKAIKTALSLYSIVHETSKQFSNNELIQAIFTDRDKRSPEHKELIEKHQGSGKEAAIALRNDMCGQAINILNQKSQPQESEEYRRWILQIASEVMYKAQDYGLLGLGRSRAEAETTQALQDLARVLQLS